MTPKQKLVIAVLAITNGVAILALGWFIVAGRSSQAPVLHNTSPSVVPSIHTLTPLQQTCQWRAVQQLAQAGLGGTVKLTPPHSLRFDITYRLAPGQDAEEAAQAVWTAFDVALALRENQANCAVFTQIEVTVLAVRTSPHLQTDARINARVSTADLAAFSAGELSEDELIHRVAYDLTRQ